MAAVQEIKAGIAAACDRIDGLRCYGEMPDNPQVPATAVFGPTRWQYSQTFEGLVVYTFELHTVVSYNDKPRAQQALDAYIAPTGAKSIPAALNEWGTTTLEGLAESVRVVGGFRPYLVVESSGGPLLEAVVEVEVYAS